MEILPIKLGCRSFQHFGRGLKGEAIRKVRPAIAEREELTRAQFRPVEGPKRECLTLVQPPQRLSPSIR